MTLQPIATRLPSPVATARRAPLLAFFLSLLVAAAPASAGGWTVSGTVIHSDGSPVANATVRLRAPSGSEASTASDASGQYSLSMVDASSSGSALVWAEKGSCSSQPAQLIDRDITQTLTVPGSGGSC